VFVLQLSVKMFYSRSMVKGQGCCPSDLLSHGAAGDEL